MTGNPSLQCQNGHPIVPCDCGAPACPGYFHVKGTPGTAGHYCRSSPGEAWVNIKGEPDDPR